MITTSTITVQIPMTTISQITDGIIQVLAAQTIGAISHQMMLMTPGILMTDSVNRNDS